MKTPRVTDFDPNAPEVEAPEAAAAAKPLSSPLDGMPAIVRPSSATNASISATRAEERASVPSVSPPLVPSVRGVPPDLTPLPAPSGGTALSPLTSSPSNHGVGRGAEAGGGGRAGAGTLPRRPIKQRHPFDIYADQLDSLRQLSFEERIQGGVGSMSAMVRDALDAYIAAKTRTRVDGQSRSPAEEHGTSERLHHESRAEDAPEDAV